MALSCLFSFKSPKFELLKWTPKIGLKNLKVETSKFAFHTSIFQQFEAKSDLKFQTVLVFKIESVSVFVFWNVFFLVFMSMDAGNWKSLI